MSALQLDALAGEFNASDTGCSATVYNVSIIFRGRRHHVAIAHHLVDESSLRAAWAAYTSES